MLAADEADFGIAAVKAVHVRRCREIAPLGNHPGRARRQRLSGLRERFHANRRHAIDQDLEAIVTHDIAADTIDLLPEHPWLGSEMTLQDRKSTRLNSSH